MAILISVDAELIDSIFHHRTSYIINKRKPKIKTPFKCYIYCKNDRTRDLVMDDRVVALLPKLDFKRRMYLTDSCICNGLVIGEFICDNIIKADCGEYHKITIVDRYENSNGSSLDAYGLMDYADGHTIYGWHVSNFTIYDKPKWLTDFCQEGYYCDECDNCPYNQITDCADGHVSDCTCPFPDGYKPVKNPPKPWSYVREL